MSSFARQRTVDATTRRPTSPWETHRPNAGTTTCCDKLISPWSTTKTFRASQGPLLPDVIKTPREVDCSHLALPLEILRPKHDSCQPLRKSVTLLCNSLIFSSRVGASSCKAALASDGPNLGFRQKSNQRFRSLPSNSQQSVYYTCCPSVSSEDEFTPPGARVSSDLWSLPLRSCLSDTNIPIDFETLPPPEASHSLTPFFLNLSPRPFCAWRSATPAWQVLMRRMVGRSRRAAPSHNEEVPTAPSSSIDDPVLFDAAYPYVNKSHLTSPDSSISILQKPFTSPPHPIESKVCDAHNTTGCAPRKNHRR